MSSEKDHRLTIISVSALACIVQHVVHEALGHGLTAWLSGAHGLAFTTVVLQSDVETRWISASGTLANLLFGAILGLLLLRPQRYRPATHYFLVLTMAANLFAGSGYIIFSAVANFGDWAAVIAGLQPHRSWRLGLLVLGVASYSTSVPVVAAKLRPFRGQEGSPRRLRVLAWTPYFTEGLLGVLAGLVNPLGLSYIVASVLPSTLGGNAGLLIMPSLTGRRSHRNDDHVPALQPSVAWIATAAVAGLLFILVLGRGFTWSR